MGGQSHLGLSVPSWDLPSRVTWDRLYPAYLQCSLWWPVGKGCVGRGGGGLGPGLGVDTTASPLSAMPSTPVPVPKPLLPSPPHTEAAQQLDELLADLGHTQSKVSLGPGAPGWGVWPSPRPHHAPSRQLAAAGQGAGVPTESSLDNMLDSLTRDLQELGIMAAPAGVCASCRKPIAGKVSSHCQPGTPGHPQEPPSQPLCLLLTGAHSSGQNLAPRALHLCPLRAGAGQGALLRAGRAGVLRGGLSPGFLPALRLLRRPHPRGQ